MKMRAGVGDLPGTRRATGSDPSLGTVGGRSKARTSERFKKEMGTYSKSY